MTSFRPCDVVHFTQAESSPQFEIIISHKAKNDPFKGGEMQPQYSVILSWSEVQVD